MLWTALDAISHSGRHMRAQRRHVPSQPSQSPQKIAPQTTQRSMMWPCEGMRSALGVGVQFSVKIHRFSVPLSPFWDVSYKGNLPRQSLPRVTCSACRSEIQRNRLSTKPPGQNVVNRIRYCAAVNTAPAIPFEDELASFFSMVHVQPVALRFSDTTSTPAKTQGERPCHVTLCCHILTIQMGLVLIPSPERNRLLSEPSRNRIGGRTAEDEATQKQHGLRRGLDLTEPVCCRCSLKGR
jgi:hypothetical protein